MRTQISLLDPSVVIKPFLEWTETEGLKVNFHDGQTDLWYARERHVVASCGTQSGKTCTGSPWLHREIDDWLWLDPQEQGDFLAVSATYPLMNLKMMPQMKLYFETYLGIAKYNKADRQFVSMEKIRGGPLWVIFLGSADNPESLESATAIAAWLDEPGQKRFKRESMEAINRRVSIHRGRILYTTTPYVFGWFKREVYDRAVAGKPGYKLINFSSIMNPVFPREEYEEQKEKLPRWKHRMFYDGIFERPAGQIYDCFDTKACVQPRHEIPLDWPKYCGIDFGPVHTAILFYAIQPVTRKIILYRAMKTDSKQSAYDNIQAWRSKMHRDSKGNVDEIITMSVGGAHGESGWRDAYSAQGWAIVEPYITGPDSVEVQIEKVYAFNKANMVIVFDDLYDYLDEKESFSRELNDSYEPTDKIEDESSFHYMAAERYILCTFELPTTQPQQSGRWQGEDDE